MRPLRRAPCAPARRFISTIAWYGVAFPGLVLNYFGQVAYLYVHPKSAENPFFAMAPEGTMRAILTGLSIIAAIIASQALISGAPAKDVTRLRKFGETIGWAFQVTDDILDVEESSAALGKTAGKDVAQQKATYPALYGLPRSHEIANELAHKAIAALEPYGERAARLRQIAEFLVLRRT